MDTGERKVAVGRDGGLRVAGRIAARHAEPGDDLPVTKAPLPIHPVDGRHMKHAFPSLRARIPYWRSPR